MSEQENHVESGRQKTLTRLFYVVCVLLFLLDAVDWVGKTIGNDTLHFRHHAKLAPEGWPTFFSVYAFVGIIVLVFGSRLLRKIVMRKEDYYDE